MKPLPLVSTVVETVERKSVKDRDLARYYLDVSRPTEESFPDEKESRNPLTAIFV